MTKAWLGSAALLAIAALLILRPWEEGSGRNEGPARAVALVTRVVDGDTVEAEIDGEEEDVRLIGVDTPESVTPDEPVECFGPRASAFSERLLEGKRVQLVFGEERVDPYDRLLAYAYLDPSLEAHAPNRPLFVNAALVRRGLARTLTIPPNDRFAPLLRRLERGAARAGRGLWGACPP
ncbi:MAG TPA: thermonuclease family protein [Solirubrobacterales bacterium]|nr:thermonuclease family protein [Solirubrobacterales bacterium]